MKIYSLLAGIGICCGLANVANAKIVTGSAENYFSKVYATDLAGNRLTNYDQACKSKHWALTNSGFYADFRVNTESNNNVAFMRYANAETQLVNHGFDAEKGRYVFTAPELPQSLKDMNAKSLTFSLDYEMWHSEAQIVFNPVDVNPTHNMATQDDCHHGDCHHDCNHDDCHHDCHHVATAYQCVISTY